MDKFTIVANLANFLQETNGSVLTKWNGKLTAKQQRDMFGKYLGKGRIYIDGNNETIAHHIKVCFGLDSDVTFYSKWSDIENKSTKR